MGNIIKRSLNGSVFNTIVYIFVFLLFAKLIALAKDVRIAYVFGTDSVLDEYFYIFNNSIVFVGLWLSVLTVVLLPLLVKNKHSDEVKINNLIDVNFTVSLVFSLLFCLYLVLFDSFFQQGNFYLYNLILAFCIIFFGFNASFFSVILMSRDDNKNSVLECLPSLIVLILILLNPISNYVYLGTVLGFILYFFTTLFFLSKKINLSFRIPVLSLMLAPGLNSFIRSFALLLVGQIIISFAVIIDQYFLSYLEPGNLSSFNYSAKILSLITGISSIVLSRTLIPYYSKFENISKLIIVKTSLFVLLVCVFFVYISALFSKDIVSLIFGYGNFKVESINQVSNLFASMLYQAPFFIASMVLLSYYSSINYFIPFFVTGFTAIALKATYLNIMIDRIDASIIAESTVLMYFGNFVILLFFLLKPRRKV